MSIPLPNSYKDSKAAKVVADMANGWTLSTDISVSGSGLLNKVKRSKPVSTTTITFLRIHDLIEDANFKWPFRTYRLTTEGRRWLRIAGGAFRKSRR